MENDASRSIPRIAHSDPSDDELLATSDRRRRESCKAEPLGSRCTRGTGVAVGRAQAWLSAFEATRSRRRFVGAGRHTAFAPPRQRTASRRRHAADGPCHRHHADEPVLEIAPRPGRLVEPGVTSTLAAGHLGRTTAPDRRRNRRSPSRDAVRCGAPFCDGVTLGATSWPVDVVPRRRCHAPRRLEPDSPRHTARGSGLRGRWASPPASRWRSPPTAERGDDAVPFARRRRGRRRDGITAAAWPAGIIPAPKIVRAGVSPARDARPCCRRRSRARVGSRRAHFRRHARRSGEPHRERVAIAHRSLGAHEAPRRS